MEYDFEIEAQVLFNAYGEDALWLTWDHKPMPKWEEVGNGVRSHWKAAAKALMIHVGVYGDAS